MKTQVKIDGIYEGKPLSVNINAEYTAAEIIEVLKVYPALAGEMMSVMKKASKGK